MTPSPDAPPERAATDAPAASIHDTSPQARAATLLLAGARHGIDRIDDAMIALLATRRAMSGTAGRSKRALRRPLRDEARESQVRARMRRLADRLRVPRDTTDRLAALLIADAHGRQGAFATTTSSSSTAIAMIDPRSTDRPRGHALLRLVPPPKRWKPLLRRMPGPMRDRALEGVLSHALSHAQLGSAMDDIVGRRLGIEIADLDLRWVLQWRDGRLQAIAGSPEATVRGSATDLLLLASRLEDADTLFFQRRLVLTGDTELGLTVRNLLDRMPWEALPLGLRIALQRGGRLARAAREAYRA